MNIKLFCEKRKELFACFIKALLTAYGFLTVFHAPLIREHYEFMDFITASIYEILGKYDLVFVLVFALLFWFYHSIGKTEKGNGVLAVFFAFCIQLGRSYNEAGNWSYLFGSVVNFSKFGLVLAGYAIFIKTILGILSKFLGSVNFRSEDSHFFSKNAFWKAFGIIVLAYTPVLILSYPGNLCWDVLGQIEQVILDTGYSAHHPLLHTLIVGGLVELGHVWFGSYEIGLFVYVWLQSLMLAAAMAATIAVLAKRKVSFKVLTALLLLYVLTPIYSNLASTAIKDVPFTAAVIGYLICYALLLESPKLIGKTKFIIGFVLLQVAVILLRNNGLPLILLSGIGGFLVTFKSYDWKDRAKSMVAHFAAGILLGSLCTGLLMTVCGATAGSKGEMLSVFFQQTARYVKTYEAELTAEEISAIEAVLGDVGELGELYDPDLADYVKKEFKKDATTSELVDYLEVWLKGFFKHPAVYFEAFFHHIYGWFSPNISNAIRYEIQYDLIRQGMLFKDAEKVMVFLYRFAERFSILGILQNIGAAVWALFFYSNYNRKSKEKSLLVASLPLWVSLLVCMASPCFFGHPRYALPILLGIPFLYCFAFSKEKRR